MEDKNKKSRINPGIVIIFSFIFIFVAISFFAGFEDYISFGGDSSKIRYKDAEVSADSVQDGEMDLLSENYKFRVTFVNTTDEDIKNVTATAVVYIKRGSGSGSTRSIDIPAFDVKANSEYRALVEVDLKKYYNDISRIDASIDGRKTFKMKQAEFWTFQGVISLLSFGVMLLMLGGGIVFVAKSIKASKKQMANSKKKVVGIQVMGEDNDEYPVYEDGTLGEKNTSGYIPPDDNISNQTTSKVSNIVCPSCGYKNNKSVKKCGACGMKFK